METLYIVIVIVVGIIIVMFMLRDRITRFFARYGEGEMGINAAPPGGRGQRRSTRVTGNRIEGKRQRMQVSQTDVEVERNQMRGEDQEFLITPETREPLPPSQQLPAPQPPQQPNSDPDQPQP